MVFSKLHWSNNQSELYKTKVLKISKSLFR